LGRHGREVPWARRFDYARSLGSAVFAGEDPNLLRIIFPGLLSIDLSVDSIATCIRKNLEEIVERVRLVLSLALLNHFASEVVTSGIDGSFAQFYGLHPLLLADGFESNSAKDSWGLTR